jgi:hypothetical protein
MIRVRFVNYGLTQRYGAQHQRIGVQVLQYHLERGVEIKNKKYKNIQ